MYKLDKSQLKIRKKFAIIVSAMTAVIAISFVVLFVEIPMDRIDTTEWKTYRNEEYGFEFKYPEGGKITTNINGVCVDSSCVGYVRYDKEVSFFRLREKALHRYMEYDVFYRRKFIIVGNRIANVYIYDISGEGGSYKPEEIIVNNEKVIYAITGFNNDMLKTFKFIASAQNTTPDIP
ncbi:MAG: hypothetical protein WC823_04555 [Parcubacteria group bacterium]|jgi:hypothetical protein